jgi:DNA-binding SARP family transcriptional activator/tetratricopeptide (TPR) repeat protein
LRVVTVEIDIRVLGPLQVWAHGRQVSAGSAKQRALITLLAQHAPSAVSAEMIVAQLWPDGDRDQVRTSLYALISRTRKLLADIGAPNTVARIGGGYQLTLPPEVIDVHRFGDHLDQARAAAAREDHQRVIDLIAEALSWWREPPLADLHSDWADRRRHHLTSVTLLAAYTLLFNAHLALGDHHAVLTQLPALLERHDTNERLAGQWMQALAAAGRASEATQFYTAFQHRLVREIGTSPSAELDAVHQRITQAHASDTPAIPPSPTVATPRQLPPPPPDLPGRGDQLALLDRLAAERAVSGGTIVLCGLPGIGKTSLAQYWAHQHAGQYPGGQIYLPVYSHHTRLPLDPDIGLASMLEAVGMPADRIPADRDQRRRRLADLFAHRRMLVILDDVADTAQARALIAAGAGCLFLVTSRPQLQPLVVEDGAALIPVPPLETHDSITVLHHILGERGHPALVHAAAQAAGGVPFALRLLGHHLATRPRLAVAEHVAELRHRILEPGTEEAVTLRGPFSLSDQRLPETARLLLYRLALHPGAGIDPGAAAALADTDTTSAAHHLALLTQRSLINLGSGERVTIHDLVRQYGHLRLHETHTATQIQDARRRLLDYYLVTAAAAARLTNPHEPPLIEPDTTTPPRPLTTAEEALDWCHTEHATLLALTHDAADHGLHRHAWQLPGFYCQLLDRFGHRIDQLAAHTVAVNAAVADHAPEGLTIAVTNLGALYFRLRHYRQAQLCFRYGLDLAHTIEHDGLIGSCQYNLAATHAYLGDIPAAIRLFKTVLAASRDAGDQHDEGFALHRLGHAHRLAHDTSQAALYLHAALAIRQQLHATREQAATLAELAALHLDTGDVSPALACCTKALELDDQAGDRVAECDTLVTIAHVHARLGHHQAALRDAHRALDLSSQHADSHQRAQALTALADALALTDRHRQAAHARREAQIIRADLEMARPPLTDLPAILQSHPPSQTG